MPINSTVQLCGAKARQNNYQPCRQPAMKGKARCRMHGGKATGAKTPEGKIKSGQANLNHGFYSKKAVAERQRVRMMLRWRDDLDDIESDI